MNISLFYIPNNNHGCFGFSVVVQPLTPTTGKIISGESCSSCWQVGHDRNESQIPIGSIVKLPDGVRNWQYASREGKMRQLDISLVGRTRTAPTELIMVQKPCQHCSKVTPIELLGDVMGSDWCLECFPDNKIVCKQCNTTFARQYTCAPTPCTKCGLEVKA